MLVMLRQYKHTCSCQPCRVLGGQSSEAYGLRMTEGGIYFRDRIRHIFRCPRLQHGPGSGVTGGTTTKARKGWHVGDLKDPPPPPTNPRKRPVCTGSRSRGGMCHCMSGGGLPREGGKPHHTPGTLHPPPHEGNSSDPGGW